MRRLGIGLCCAAITVAGMAVAAPALAAPTSTANVPYLAWRGDSLKLVQCDLRVTYDGEPINLEDWGVILNVHFKVEDWSGNPAQGPRFVDTGTDNTDATPYADADFADTNESCAAATLTSLNPGLARVKLVGALTTADGPIDPDELEHFAIEPDPGKREFLAAWMTLTAPVLANLGHDSDDGRLDFGGAGDALRATVKGTVPLGNAFAGMMPGDSATLPDDWNQLAQLLAADSDTATPGSDPSLWDVHDDTLTTTGHVAGVCLPSIVLLVDAVENCTGGDASGPFSNAAGGLTSTPTVGPFDPLRLGATMLGDGKVDAGDAPMPAARVEASIAPGGVGSLQAVAKSQAYSRDATGAANPGNLFAPFYSSFVPATAADPSYSSGTTSGGANNYPDTSFAPYVYWEPFAVATRSGGNACRNPLGTLYEYPGGAESASVYTDEHGEARFHLSPGGGLLLTPDSQSRCDLGLYDTEATPNAFSVVARAHYPAPIPGGPLVSTALAFLRQNERAGSSLNCLQKAAVDWVCFHRISRPDGQPLAGAQVRVSGQGVLQVVPDGTLFGGFDSRGQGIVQVDPSSQWAVLSTNAAGTVGFLARRTLPGTFDVLSEEIGTRNGGPGVSRAATLPPTPPDPDLDDDGIENNVDPNPTVASADFSDGAGTTGTITDRGGLTVTVANASPGGVTVTTSGAGGPATVTACTGFTVTIAAGSSITLTCGSITIAVATGSATIVLGGGLTTVTILSGAAAQVALTPSGSYTVASLAGTVTLVVDGVVKVLSPGPAITVQTWNFDGFFAPVEPAPALNKVNAGQAIPLKWRLTNAAGSPVTSLTTATIHVATYACTSGTTPSLASEATNGALKHNGGGNYELVWKTPKSYAGSCKALHLDIGDGVTHTALFSFR